MKRPAAATTTTATTTAAATTAVHRSSPTNGGNNNNGQTVQQPERPQEAQEPQEQHHDLSLEQQPLEPPPPPCSAQPSRSRFFQLFGGGGSSSSSRHYQRQSRIPQLRITAHNNSNNSNHHQNHTTTMLLRMTTRKWSLGAILSLLILWIVLGPESEANSIRRQQQQHQLLLSNNNNNPHRLPSKEEDANHGDSHLLSPPPPPRPETLLIPDDDARLSWDPFAVDAAIHDAQQQQQQPQWRRPPTQDENDTTALGGWGWWNSQHNLHQMPQHKSGRPAEPEPFQYIRTLFRQRYGPLGRSMLTQSLRIVHRNTPYDFLPTNNLNNNNNTYNATNHPEFPHNSLASLVRALQQHEQLLQQQEQQQQQQHKPSASSSSSTWHVVVLGNGAAAGYGNHRSQAYSQLLRQLWQSMVSASHQQQDGTRRRRQRPRVQVTNLALDQGTEFPTTWCLSTWLGIQQQQQQQREEQQEAAAAAAKSKKHSDNSNQQAAISTAAAPPPPPFLVIVDFTGSTVVRLEAVLRHLLHLGVPMVAVRIPPHWSLSSTTTTNNNNDMNEKSTFWNVLSHYCPLPAHQQQQQQQGESNVHVVEEDKKNDDDKKFDHFQACLWLEPVQEVMEPFVASLTAHTTSSSSSSSSRTTTSSPFLLPAGLDGWYTRFGGGRAPPTYHELDHLPHQRPYYLTAPQHAWIAWTLAMPFLSAFQIMAATATAILDEHDVPQSNNTTSRVLPPPVVLDKKMKGLDPLILGISSSSSLPVQCFSSFEFVTRLANLSSSSSSHDKNALNIPGNLPKVITSRNIMGNNQELLQPKMAVQRDAWVYDLDDATRSDKRQMQHHKHHQAPAQGTKEEEEEAAFYGMPDWKIAYYGAYQSGILKLSLPISLAFSDSVGQTSWLQRRRRRPSPLLTSDVGFYNASDYIQSLIVCQADTPMLVNKQVTGCSWKQDVQIRVAVFGNSTTSTTTTTTKTSSGNTIMAVASSKPLDASFEIVVSTRGGTRPEHAQPLCRRVVLPAQAQLRLAHGDDDQQQQQVDGNVVKFQLDMEIEVTNPRVMWHPKHSIPCSLSHILVEPRVPPPQRNDEGDYKQNE